MKQLILGGARSGKSRLAEHLTGLYGDRIAYIATADQRHHDAEMRARVAHHQQQRPEHWHTLEIPLLLGEALQTQAADFDAVMVDCLTLWVSNCLLAEDTDVWPQQKQALLDALTKLPTPIILVSNEVGLGVVPMGELSRRFVDQAGFLNQAVAGLCDRVVFTAAGCPLVLKGAPLSHSELPAARTA